MQYVDEGDFISDRDTFVFLRQSLVVSCSMQMLLRREKMSLFQPDAHKHTQLSGTDDIDCEGANQYLGDLDNGHEIMKREAERTVFIAEKVICLVNLMRLSEN